MIGLKVIDDVLLAVTKEFMETATRQPHCNYPVGNIAQVEVEARVSVPVAVTGDYALDD